LKILVVVPARGGSKGVPGKNIRNLAGSPLISYVINAARNSSHQVRVICSTDSEEIAEIAEDFGAEVPFIRPAEFSGDKVAAIAPIKHAMEFFDANEYKADIIVALHPTSPLLTTELIDDAISQLMENEDIDSVVGVRRIEHNHPFRAYALDEGGLLQPLTEYTSEKYLQKQDRPDAYGFVGGLYVRRRKLVEDWNGAGFALGNKTGTVVVPHDRAVDIDHELDFRLVEVIVEYLKEKETAK
jgi:CMP-N-acetylneuraminic acid synthetase